MEALWNRIGRRLTPHFLALTGPTKGSPGTLTGVPLPGVPSLQHMRHLHLCEQVLPAEKQAQYNFKQRDLRHEQLAGDGCAASGDTTFLQSSPHAHSIVQARPAALHSQ